MIMNFNEVLKKKAADIERPPILPPGTYLMQVAKAPALDSKSSDKGNWDTLDFTLLPVAAMEDVDPELLAAYGPFTPAASQRVTFMFDKDNQTNFDRTLFNLKRFLLDHLQIPGGEESALKELLDQCVGLQCQAFIRWDPDKNDPEIQYPRIVRTAAAT